MRKIMRNGLVVLALLTAMGHLKKTEAVRHHGGPGGCGLCYVCGINTTTGQGVCLTTCSLPGQASCDDAGGGCALSGKSC